MSTKNTPTCCGKCEKAALGTCSKLEKMLAALTPPAKEKSGAV